MLDTPDKYIQRLIESLEKKYKLLQNMKELTKEQNESIDKENIEGLHKFVDQKQSIIEDVNRLDEEFHVYFQRLKQKYNIEKMKDLDQVNIDGVKDLKAIVQKVTDIINDLIRMEKENKDNVEKMLDGSLSEIKKLNHVKKANIAYIDINKGQDVSYFIDKKK